MPLSIESLEPPVVPAEVEGQLRAGGPTVVALSGGVDSAVVAYLAGRAVGADVTAVTLVGPALAPGEIARARAVVRAVGIRHAILEIDPVQDASYRRNDSDRCYYCRRLESRSLRSWGDAHGVRQYLDGIHLDDLGDDRPGIRAMEEAGFSHPLVSAGWRKSDVRRFARSVGIPSWNQPSDACLASRIERGTPVSLALLGQIRAAEEWLLAEGFGRVRVRTDGRRARVEVDPREVPRLRTEPLASRAIAAIRNAGFSEIELDPVGYRLRAGA